MFGSADIDATTPHVHPTYALPFPPPAPFLFPLRPAWQVGAFWKSYKVCSSEAAEEASDPDDDSATVSLLAAAGCLRAMGTVCDSIALMPQLFPPLEPLLLPVLQQLLRPEGSGERGERGG